MRPLSLRSRSLVVLLMLVTGCEPAPGDGDDAGAGDGSAQVDAGGPSDARVPDARPVDAQPECRVTSLELSPTAATAVPGSETQFRVVRHANSAQCGDGDDVSDIVMWTSSDAAISTVTARGVVTALRKGASTITATLGYETSNSAALTVTDP